MFIEGIILLIGLIILVKSSELSILYSVRLSKLIGISQMAIGFLLISVITSLPELSIAIISGLQGNGLLSVGNLLGSNIINICLIFGIMAIIATVRYNNQDHKELIRSISITSVIALILVFIGQINFLFGLFCIIVFCLFFYSIYKNHYRLRTKKLKYKGLKTIETVKALFYLLISIAFVMISSKFVTDSAISISQMFGIAETIIGATIIAVGTSLPELSIAIIAIKRGNYSLALGDVIGSLVTNLTLIFGITAMLGTIVIGDITHLLAMFLLFTNMIFLFLTSAMKCSKWQGIILLLMFFFYIFAILNYQLFI